MKILIILGICVAGILIGLTAYYTSEDHRQKEADKKAKEAAVRRELAEKKRQTEQLREQIAAEKESAPMQDENHGGHEE